MRRRSPSIARIRRSGSISRAPAFTKADGILSMVLLRDVDVEHRRIDALVAHPRRANRVAGFIRARLPAK